MQWCLKQSRTVQAVTLVLFAALLPTVHPRPAAGQAPVLHIRQHVTVTRAGKTLNTQTRDYYIHNGRLFMRTRNGGILVRPDLDATWMLTDTRQPVAKLTIEELRALFSPLAQDQSTFPDFGPTGETHTVAGYPCTVYHGSLPTITLDICLTTAFHDIEPFQQLFGLPAKSRGFALALAITMRPNDADPPTVVTQLVDTIDRVSPDPVMFEPPEGDPLLPPGLLTNRDAIPTRPSIKRHK